MGQPSNSTDCSG